MQQHAVTNVRANPKIPKTVPITIPAVVSKTSEKSKEMNNLITNIQGYMFCAVFHLTDVVSHMMIVLIGCS